MSTEPNIEEPIGILASLEEEEGVRKLVECPVCLEIPLPPIYLCTKGHIVCNSCQSRTFSCPMCREPYSSTRSFVAEGIVEKCSLRCRYVESGCELILKGAKLSEHLDKCEFRPVACKECGDKLVNFAEYEQHLFKEHKLNGNVGTEACVAYRISLRRLLRSSVEEYFWPQYYVKAFGKIFLLRLNSVRSTIHPWICLLGPQTECPKYTATIEYDAGSDGSIVHSWKGPVNHFRDDPEEVMYHGKALCVSLDTILQTGAVSTDLAEWSFRIALYEKETSSSDEVQKASSKQNEKIACKEKRDEELSEAEATSKSSEIQIQMPVSPRAEAEIMDVSSPSPSPNVPNNPGNETQVLEILENESVSNNNNSVHSPIPSVVHPQLTAAPAVAISLTQSGNNNQTAAPVQVLANGMRRVIICNSATRTRTPAPAHGDSLFLDSVYNAVYNDGDDMSEESSGSDWEL